jgi:predicted transcriptional regulator of viral defense system
MARSRLQIAKRKIFETLDGLEGRVLMLKDLRAVLAQNRDQWNLAQATTSNDFVDFLQKKGRLRVWRFDLPYRPETRYTWGDAPIFKVLGALKPGAYFSHYPALYHHGLTEQIPKAIYLNSEQPLKGKGSSRQELQQSAIDRAFRAKPRQSSNFVDIGEYRVCLISGKNTSRLGVVTARDGELQGFPVTGLERTLLDAAVRPFYAGGPFEVLKAYRNAKGRLSTNRLAQLLKKIDLVYPYHQAIGFYLDAAGYPEKHLARFLEMGLDYDFYLAYQLSDPAYSKKWRIYYPKGLSMSQRPTT